MLNHAYYDKFWTFPSIFQEKILQQTIWVRGTSRGFFPQSADHYGLSGERYQTHYSGWEPEEFEQLGYEVLILKDFHDSDNISFVETFGRNHPPIDALLAWKNQG